MNGKVRLPVGKINPDILASKEEGMTLIKEGRKLALPVYHQDELSKIFG